MSQRDYKSTNHIVIGDGGEQSESAAFRKSRRAASVTDDETWVDAEHANTLNAFDQGDVRTTHAVVEQASTLQAGGGERGNRLDAEMAAGGQLVAQAYSIREDAKADTFSATEIEAARCLQKHQPSVQSHHAQTFVAEQMTVRRLTPVECERLMGWPDNFTAPDGVKAPDSKRYAACGDGIVAPVAFWIADRIRMIEEEGGV